MGQIDVSIRMDEGLKQDFDSLCNKLGFNMTVAFNIFAKNVLLHNGIPFAVSLDVPNAQTIAAINEVQLMKKEPNKKLYSSFSELVKEIEADV